MLTLNEVIQVDGGDRPLLPSEIDGVLAAALPEDYSGLIGLRSSEFRARVGDLDLGDLVRKAEANAVNSDHYEPGSNSSNAVLRAVAAVRRDFLNE
ncbi:MAG: hypothetical protein WC777_00190 [Candidatus Gracilibacteria bacterium]|jgi:hypothetical protein